MTLKDDFNLTFPWDAEAHLSGQASTTTPEQTPLEEYIAFLEDIDALRSAPFEIKEFREPFTL